MTARVRDSGPRKALHREGDPDRPLLTLLNRSAGRPVLAMCGRPGNHDPAHAAAGRLPVRFHKFSDVRLYWKEFPRTGSLHHGGLRWRADVWHRDRQQPFVALVVLTNADDRVIDANAAKALACFGNRKKPVLWGEAAADRAVIWRSPFCITHRPLSGNGALPPPADLLAVETGFARGEDGTYYVIGASHYLLLTEEEVRQAFAHRRLAEGQA
jgi:hypothetical protein